jgi:phage replication-related protein YjqB (UPF0714/DUF867 family)
MDTYLNFLQLSACEKEGEDYEIESVFRDSSVAVIAPHGGRIEPFTTELAEMIAGNRFSFYTFKGLKPHGNTTLHITSHRFDEPRALKLVNRCQTIVAIHGQKHLQDAFIMVGGKDIGLLSHVTSAFRLSGFKLRPPDKRLLALHKKNICNRGKSKQGIQIELSRGLRRLLKSNPESCDAFLKGIRSVLLKKIGKGVSQV